VRTRTVVSRTACHFHVLHRRAVEALRAEIPVLDRVCLLGCGCCLSVRGIRAPCLWGCAHEDSVSG
jgi:hypothetical protein